MPLLLLSKDALEWLKAVRYGERSHEERMVLIKAAKILFPYECSEDDDC